MVFLGREGLWIGGVPFQATVGFARDGGAVSQVGAAGCSGWGGVDCGGEGGGYGQDGDSRLDG